MDDTAIPTSKLHRITLELDRAIEKEDIETAVSFFADNCVIEVLGLTLTGKDGARRWFKWLYRFLEEFKIIPVMAMTEGNTIFEEYILDAKGDDGTVIKSKQAEVTVFDDNLEIKSLRIYFDRFDFASLVAKGIVAKGILREITRTSLKGLI
ncbi:MAG: nuclear transport factor 2 family protein [Firmicutes bacterium]|nr:nuclear transport factor 2 family protein [Bacillota bacterium]